MALRHRQSRAARRGAAGGHRGGTSPRPPPAGTSRPRGHSPAGAGRGPGRAMHRGHRRDTPITNTRPWGTRPRSVPSALQSSPKAWSLSPQSHPGSLRPPWGWGVGGGDSMTPRGWCHRSLGSANHPGRKSSSCCWGVLKEDQDGDPVALSVAPSLSPALGMALALCWAPGNPRQSCSPVLHLQADAAELQPALCMSATSFNLGQEEHSPAFLMGMYCIPGLLCSLPG